MYSLRFFVAAPVAVLALVATLTGCSAADGGPAEVVLVVAPIEGAPFVGPSMIEPYLDSIDGEGDRVTVIVADGDPFVAGDWLLTDLPQNVMDLEDAIEAVHVEVKRTVTSAEAVTPESNITEAVRLAEGSFSSAAGSKTLIVLSPMLQTTGVLSLVDGRFGLPVEELMSFVDENHGFAQLTSVSVRVPRAGVVEMPQPTLDGNSRDHLQEIWKAYFTSSGAAEVVFDTASLEHRPQEGDLPHVTPVAIDRISAECAVTLDDASIPFEVGAATFAHADSARASIERAQSELAGCEGDFLVEGSASSEGDPQQNVDLSGARATAAAAELASLADIDVTTVGIVAWGATWPCRLDDVDDSGALIESAAAANRVVVISRGVAPGTC